MPADMLDLDDTKDDEVLDGEFVELEDDDAEIEETPDGGAIVRFDDSPKRGDSDFYTNLADVLSQTELQSICTTYLDLIGRDKEARSKRDEQYEMGIRRTGLGDDAPGGAQFQGANKVVHPMLTETCVDFAARAIKELWPADGPVKSKIIGDVTKEKVAKAARKSDFMNWQLTVQAQEARAEFEQMLTQVPLGGNQYLKVTWDEKRNRPSFLFVAIDDIYLPYAATNFYTAERKTHVQYLTQVEFQKRCASGMYSDTQMLAASGMTPEQSRAAVANDKVEGREETAYNEDGLRTVFEIYAIADIEGDPEADGAAPYIISIDKVSNKVLSIYRNWDEDDPSQEELQWMVDFPFVPWRGAYAIGMIHMIGGLSAAATGALRALLDAAHIANSQTMLKLKGGTRGGQSLNIQPTEVLEIEGGLNVDDIRKLAMPLPFNQPSGTLFNLLGFLVEAGKGVVRTTMDDVADSNTEMPVGTTLAKIEQGMVVFSSIHARLHDSMGRMLRVLHRLNAMYLEDREEAEEAGSVIASRADFNGPMDVVPVSDPNIFSEAQRYAQTQAVAQRAALQPMLYDARKVEERILETLKIPNSADLLVPAQTPTEENAVSENVKATLGKPIVAFPDQDHIAHLKTHIPYLQSPWFGSSQLMAPSYQPIMLGHLKEHLALWYAGEVFATANEVTDEPLSDLIGKTKDKDDKRALDQLVAEASLDVIGSAQWIQKLDPVIQQAIQMVQQMSPPMQDPAVQVAMEDVKMRGSVAAAKDKTEQAKIAAKQQSDAEDRAAELQQEQIKQAAEDERVALREAAQTDRNDADNAVAEELALMNLMEGREERVSQDPNPQPR